MNVDLLFRIAGVGMIMTFAHIIFKQAGKDEYALAVTWVGLAIILGTVGLEIWNLLSTVASVFKLR